MKDIILSLIFFAIATLFRSFAGTLKKQLAFATCGSMAEAHQIDSPRVINKSIEKSKKHENVLNFELIFYR